jgi:hypothetical protein
VSLKVFLYKVVPEKNFLPGAVIAILIFGDFLGFNHHCHILVPRRLLLQQGHVTSHHAYGTKKLEDRFRYKIIRIILNFLP